MLCVDVSECIRSFMYVSITLSAYLSTITIVIFVLQSLWKGLIKVYNTVGVVSQDNAYTHNTSCVSEMYTYVCVCEYEVLWGHKGHSE